MHLNLHELYYNLGHVLHQQGDLSGAADSYQRSLVLRPDYVNAHHNLGVVLDEQGQRPAAIDCYRQAIALNPRQIKSYNNLGCVLLKQGQIQEAIQVYRQAIALQPTWDVLYGNLGQALLAHGDQEGAIAAYRRAIELQPAMIAAHHQLGRVWQRLGQHTAAVDCFEQAIRLEPSQTEIYSDWAVSLLALGELAQAMNCLQQAIALYRTFIDSYCAWAETLTGHDELTQAKIACSRFLQTLQHSTDRPELYLALGQTYRHLANVLVAYGGAQQYRDAEVLYQKALQIFPQDADLHQRLGHCLMRQGRLEAAILVYHTALTIDPNQAQARFELGQTLEKQQRLEDAIACYREVWSLGTAGWSAVDRGRLLAIVPGGGRSVGLPERIYRSAKDWVKAGSECGRYVEVEEVETRLIAEEEVETRLIASLQRGGGVGEVEEVGSRLACAGLNCMPCLQKLLSSFEPVQVAKQVYTCSGQAEVSVERLPTFVTTIPQGRAWVVPQQNDWMVCNAIAILTPDNALLSDVSRDYPGQLPGCRSSSPSGHRIFELEALPSPEQVKGTVAVLAGLSGNTYFHWMIDVLPRLEILRRGGINVADVDWFLVNSDRAAFQRETLELLGVPAAKVIQSDRHPYIQATQLVVPSFPGHLGWMQPWALTFLRRAFLPAAAAISSSHLPERIYISRAKARYRRVFNEPDVVQLLERFGFVSVDLEALSFQEQVALFSHAKAIVAPHGSGLTNTVFCQPQTTIVELVSPHYLRHYYWVISRLLDLNHYYVSGQILACHPIRELMYPNPLTEDILIDLNSLLRMMKLIGLPD